MSALQGQAALVTGAGSGIGRALAGALAAHGASVWLAGRTAGTLEETAALVRGHGGEAHVCPADLEREDDIAVLARAVHASGALDILVHNAGAMTFGTVEATPVSELDRQYRISLRAPYLLTQALLPLLRARRGQIVFVNSSAGLTARQGLTQYAAAKFGQKALADGLRGEVNRDGIRVVSIYPGRTATAMHAAFAAKEGVGYRDEDLAQPADIASIVLNALMLPRTAEVTDLSVRPMQPGTRS